MFSLLKNHPFAVNAFFDSSVVLTYAVPKDDLAGLVPACLALDTFNDRWGFVALAMVQTRALRPTWFPKFLGSDFFLVGYRVFVRYSTLRGNRLRGLYILGSQTNSRRMETFGNIFTHYNYSTIDIDRTVRDGATTIRSDAGGLEVTFKSDQESPPLPAGSPFTTWKEARRFAGPLPFTFTYDASSKKVLIIEGVRASWNPRPIEITAARVDFFERLKIGNATLANAFMVENIPYRWKRGRQEKWGE